MEPVNKTLNTKNCQNSSASGLKTTNNISGLIVKASSKGFGLKSYELLVFLGGDKFSPISTTSQSIYECALEWLKSGKKVSVTYKEALVKTTISDTNFDIVSISGINE